MTGFRQQLFVSYSRRHEDQVIELAQEIESHGVNSVWGAWSNIAESEDWKAPARFALTQSVALVACLSADYYESEHCREERVWALEYGLPIVGIALDNQEGRLVEPLAATIDRNVDDIGQQLAALLRGLGGETSS